LFYRYAKRWPNNAINADVQKHRFALLLYAGYGDRWATGMVWRETVMRVIARKTIEQDFEGITRVEIINRRENVQLKQGKRSLVRVEGLLKHPILGLSRSDSTLYLSLRSGKKKVPGTVDCFTPCPFT
jgi:hypothetical protein